ncbi:hypothetical protein DFH08DRAFT_822902 [Mycena albidolilacea]|uniref:Uncharacterized protein n=1 Tax=Mycena albidolilacea TaxID=1033008 RepID=A0AAD6Z781_9AGAR|nr:hypothetical protein DFH08DRAFT_822902 [Mycena albidolilacea]
MLLPETLPLGLWVLGSTGSCSKQSLRSDLPSQYRLEAQSLGVGCKAVLHGVNTCGPILSSVVMLLRGSLHFAVDVPLANRDTRQVCGSADNSLVLLLCVYYPNARWAAGITLSGGSNNTIVAKVKAHWAADEFGLCDTCLAAVSIQDELNVRGLMADRFWLVRLPWLVLAAAAADFLYVYFFQFPSVIARDQPDVALVDHGPSQPLVGGGPRINGKFAAEAVVPRVVDKHGINICNLHEGSFMFECRCLLDDVKRLLRKVTLSLQWTCLCRECCPH